MSYYTDDPEQIGCGYLVGDDVAPYADVPLDVLLRQGPLPTPGAAAAVLARSEVTIVAPIPRPPSVRDFMSFEEHVVTSMKALDRPVEPVWYERPVFYFTNPSAVRGPDEPVPRAPGSERWDYEFELAAVIGTRGSDITVEEAEEYVAGYSILCDWSARDIQALEMPVGLGPAKAKDTVTTLGPALITPDELDGLRAGKGFDVAMLATVNGAEYSRGNWRTIYWSFAEMIATASRGTTLHPGDVIGSGTVGTGCILELQMSQGSDSFPWLQPGDVVSLDAGVLGRLDMTVDHVGGGDEE